MASAGESGEWTTRTYGKSAGKCDAHIGWFVERFLHLVGILKGVYRCG